MSCCNNDFLRKRLAAIEALIEQYELALLAFSDDINIQSYTLNTGQTTQTVTRLDVTRLQAALPSMYNQQVTLSARLNGCGTKIMGAAW